MENAKALNDPRLTDELQDLASFTNMMDTQGISSPEMEGWIEATVAEITKLHPELGEPDQTKTGNEELLGIIDKDSPDDAILDWANEIEEELSTEYWSPPEGWKAKWEVGDPPLWEPKGSWGRTEWSSYTGEERLRMMKEVREQMTLSEREQFSWPEGVDEATGMSPMRRSAVIKAWAEKTKNMNVLDPAYKMDESVEADYSEVIKTSIKEAPAVRPPPPNIPAPSPAGVSEDTTNLRTWIDRIKEEEDPDLTRQLESLEEYATALGKGSGTAELKADAEGIIDKIWERYPLLGRPVPTVPAEPEVLSPIRQWIKDARALNDPDLQEELADLEEFADLKETGIGTAENDAWTEETIHGILKTHPDLGLPEGMSKAATEAAPEIPATEIPVPELEAPPDAYDPNKLLPELKTGEVVTPTQAKKIRDSLQDGFNKLSKEGKMEMVNSLAKEFGGDTKSLLAIGSDGNMVLDIPSGMGFGSKLKNWALAQGKNYYPVDESSYLWAFRGGHCKVELVPIGSVWT